VQLLAKDGGKRGYAAERPVAVDIRDEDQP